MLSPYMIYNKEYTFMKEFAYNLPVENLKQA